MNQHRDHEVDRDVSELLASLRDAAPSREVRERIVQNSLRRMRKRPRLSHPLGFSFAAAAAALALGLGLHWLAPGTLEGSEPALPAKGSLHAAAELPSAFSIGPHRVHLSPSSTVKVEAAERHLTELRVEAGTALFDVAPLVDGATFRVRTDHVLVEVVGTRFSVRNDGNCSLVLVEEGKVRVTDLSGTENHLLPNQQRRYCPGQTADRLLREALVSISRGEGLDQAAELLTRYLREAPDGSLEEEALFHLALVHARLGNHEEAARLAREFEGKFPHSGRLDRLRARVDTN